MSKNKQDYNKTGQNEAISNVFSLHRQYYNYNKYISVHNNISFMYGVLQSCINSPDWNVSFVELL